MPPPTLSQPSRSELFYDLVLIGAFLSFGVDFGKSPNWESGIVLAMKLTLIMWAWEQTALFFNRFGDPFSARHSGTLLPTALRFAFLIQLVAVLGVSLLETSETKLSALNGPLGYGGAAVVLAIGVIYELGARWQPELAKVAHQRRNASLVGAVLFIASGLSPQPWGAALWMLAVIAIFVMNFGPTMPTTLKLFPLQREHLSERLGLFVLILIGDVFVKTVVTVHEDSVQEAHLLQLAFVAAISWTLWTIYDREVMSRPMPEIAARLRAWMLWHYLFAIVLLICSVGLVWYIAPNAQYQLGDWIAMVAAGGVGVAVALVALMRITAGAPGARAAAARLGVIAVVAVVIGLLAWLATPSDWRVGVGTLAVAMVALNYWAFRNDPRPASADQFG